MLVCALRGHPFTALANNWTSSAASNQLHKAFTR